MLGKTPKSHQIKVDTTVQEKNIAFPTDVKLYRKIIARCHKVAKDESIVLRRSYSSTTLFNKYRDNQPTN